MPNNHQETIRQLTRQNKVQENVIEQLNKRIAMLESINQQQTLSTDLANTTYCIFLAELTRMMKLKDDEIREKDQKLTAIQEILNKKSATETKPDDGKKTEDEEEKKPEDVLDSLD